MSKLFIEESTLTDIGNAIRAKGGTTALIPTTGMAAAISNLSTGGDASLPAEALVLPNNCENFNREGWMDWYWTLPGITTDKLLKCTKMFEGGDMETIPFELNFHPSTGTFQSGEMVYMGRMFYDCKNLKELPKFNNKPHAYTMYMMFYNCHNLREIPEDFDSWFEWKAFETNSSTGSSETFSQQNMFYKCHSLRKMPVAIFGHGLTKCGYYYSPFGSMAYGCYALDELVDIPLPSTAAWNSNGFANTFYGCYHLKNVTFKMPDGVPYTKQWSKQLLDLSKVGFSADITDEEMTTDYNSGLTMDKKVTTDEAYQALKNDPDWWSHLNQYSRYNHDSAVATINSLPDTYGYVTSMSSTNTIKFRGIAGANTDGGAINTLTEEEIAVATAKGWTVTLT